MRSPRKPSNPKNPDYEVGFGRPPISTRFKPGNSGNTKRGPRKRTTVGEIIERSLMAKYTVTEKGQPKTMTAQEVIIRRLTLDAAGGDKRAIQTLFALRDRYQDSRDTTLDIDGLQNDDRKIIDDYLATLQRADASELIEGGSSGNDHTIGSDDTETVS
jgi:hypothetical protein